MFNKHNAQFIMLVGFTSGPEENVCHCFCKMNKELEIKSREASPPDKKKEKEIKIKTNQDRRDAVHRGVLENVFLSR